MPNVLTNYKSDDDNENVFEEKEDDDLYKDVDVRSLGTKHEKERQVVEDAHMTLTASQKTDDSKQSSFILSDFASKFLILENVPPAVDEVSSMMNVKSRFDQRVSTLETELSQLKQADQSAQLLKSVKSQLLTMVDDLLSIRIRYATRTSLESYTKDFKKKAQEERKLYIDVVEKSLKDIIEVEVKSLLPQILPKKVNRIKLLKKRNLYDALIKSYQFDKDLFDSYGKAYSLKRSREDKDKDEDPPAGPDQVLKKTSKDVEPSRGSKSKESKLSSSKRSKSQPKSSGKSAQEEELVFETADTEMPQDRGNDMEKPPFMFDKLLSTPIDFSAYVMHNLKIDNLTQEILVGPAFNLLKGTCKSFVELEYHFEEYYKAVTDQLNWNNPEGHGYPFDLSKPLPLIKAEGRQVVPADYFFNNDLEYLKGGSSSRKYTTSTTKTNAARYDNIEGIKDMVPEKRIIVVTHVKVMKWYGYGYLEEIIVRREDQSLHKFKEGDFQRLNLRDIEDLLLLLVQKKLSNLEQDVIFNLNVALRMFTRRIVILKLVEDLQLGVKSYQKKLNITKSETFRSGISKLTPYTAYKKPQVLYDIANNLSMDYLPKRRWSNLDKKRSRIMIKAIDQQLFERRLMRNLEKFVGGRDYRNDFRLLERTI
ncbi:hypothetical protein Tco_0910700 [Tanacetum coccineum]|uniref:Uncharacterized protein n=1 Tax=Tanacetum coccineum TaxID=301880 RepID=A0ABQ5CTM8_9ASTR